MFNFDNTYTKLPEMFFSYQNPAKNPAAEMIYFNEALAKSLGVGDLGDFPRFFSGDELPKGAAPFAQAYAGFQYGRFNVLGDGRAVVLGEHIAPGGQRFDVQLKGGGKTSYSRDGDGLAAVAPMLREVLVSEFLAAVGIPTTRCLAVVKTGKNVLRERVLESAVLTRIASSHIRVGTFDFARLMGKTDDVKALADYVIWRHFPHLANSAEKYVLLLREVADLQAKLIASWMNVGFVHGVMNTDNMAVCGETIDLGPCAFLDKYAPNTTFSSIDRHGRYAYKNQPAIGGWNLARFSESLLPLFHENVEKGVEIAEAEIETYSAKFDKYWLDGMRNKMGLDRSNEGDGIIVRDFLTNMQKNGQDFSVSFYALGSIQKGMNNPAVMPRNHHVQEALDAAENGDMSHFYALLTALRNPYQYHEKFSQPPQNDEKYITFCGT